MTTTEAIRVIATGLGTDDWRAVRADGSDVFRIRIDLSARLYGSRYYVLRDGRLADEGTFTFDAWDEAAVREVLTAIVQRMSPNAEVTVERPHKARGHEGGIMISETRTKGPRVILDIVPQRIEPADWADAYDEARSLLLAHPSRLLGYDWSTVAGVPLPVFTRAIERDRDDPTARRWCVAGERASVAVDACETMYRDLRHYLPLASTETPAMPGPGLDDILFAVAEETPGAVPEPLGRALPAHPVPGCAPAAPRRAPVGPGVVRVLGDAAPAAYCGLPLLAAAMVVEARFPRRAMVHGDITREQAEAARRWAEAVLGRPIALPVRVDAWRLVERLGARFEGEALVSAVERLHLAPAEKREATLLGIFGRAETEPWWLGKLRGYADPASPGALRLLAAYLDATRDLGRLCGLACLDARGPRYAPDALMAALASLRAPPGGLGGLDDAAVDLAVGQVFGAGAERLVEVLRRDRAASEPAPPTPTGDAEASVTSALAGLATLPSPGDLTPLQRAHVHALVTLLQARMDEGAAASSLVLTLHNFTPRQREHVHALVTVLRARMEEGAAASQGVLTLGTLATLLARSGPVLTEDAWDWITNEEDIALFPFLMALAALEDVDAEFGQVRRALFENRGLCRYAREVLQAGLGGAS